MFTLVIESLLNGMEEANWAVAGLLVVADVLERFETVAADRIECLFALDEMFRLAQYTKRINQKLGLWTRMKRAATRMIVTSSIECCALIDPYKFALFEHEMDGDKLIAIEDNLIEKCAIMAEAITEGFDESVSLLEQMCARMEDFSEGEDKQMSAFAEYFFRDEDESGTSSDEESSVSSAKACSTATTEEEE